MQRFQQQAVTTGPYRAKVLLAPHRQLPESCLFRIAQGVAHHAIGVFGQFIGGHNVVGLVEIKRGNFTSAYELYQFECLLGFELDGVDLVLFEQEVFIVSYLVTLHDLGGIHRPDAGHRLFVFHPLARGAVDLAEGHARARLGGRMNLHRDRYEGQPKLPFPQCT